MLHVFCPLYCDNVDVKLWHPIDVTDVFLLELGGLLHSLYKLCKVLQIAHRPRERQGLQLGLKGWRGTILLVMTGDEKKIVNCENSNNLCSLLCKSDVSK